MKNGSSLRSYMSIRSVIVLLTILFLLVILFSFYIFYNTSKNTMGDLISCNIKSNTFFLIEEIRRDLEEQNDRESILSKIRLGVISNDFVKNIVISNANGKNLYFYKPINSLQNIKSIKLSECDGSKIFYTESLKSGFKINNKMQSYYYKVDVILDKEHIDSLLNDILYKVAKYFSLSFLFVIFLIWVIIERSIVVPLRKLREFAYYHLEKPKKFIVKEIESIRYSLEITFNRLEKEQKELYKLSTKDSLTNLYNRISLFAKIDELIVKSKREHTRFCILFLDLDNFKDINDLYGHDVGDLVLQKVSKVMLASIRENDFPCRIGGDEFVVIIEEYSNSIVTAEICNRLLKSISNSIDVKNRLIKISTSIGVVIYPENGSSGTELIKNADIAMYKAKSLGKNQFYFFNNNLNIILHEKLKLQQKMATGLKNGDFELYYQPKVDLSTGKIVSCEALIRWNDKEEGLIPPFKFIPLAEENDFILTLGDWVLKEGTKRIKKWENTPFENIKISINLSAKQFKDSKIVEKIKRYSENIDRKKLDLEITESVFLKNSKDIIEMITKIKKLGITFSLDDFGTGYSSLSYLKDIPIDTLKIDKSFIDSYNDKTGKTFIEMIVDIGHILNLQVVAEGVETKEQLYFLKSVKCDIIQGYYYSKPLRAEEFEKFYMDFMAK